MSPVAVLTIIILILIIVIMLLRKQKNRIDKANTGIIADIIDLEKKAKDVKNEKKPDNINDLLNQFCDIKRKY
jgi:competence protein ComGC